MDDILLNLLVLAAFILLGGLIFLLVRRARRRTEAGLLQLSQEKGWHHTPIRQPLARGFRLHTAHWVLEALSTSSGTAAAPGSSEVVSTTTWTSPAAAGTTLLIGANTSPVDLGAIGASLTRTLLHHALGADAEGLQPVAAGSQAFQKRYRCWAQAPADLRISPALESLLLNWQGTPPLIKRTSAALTITLQGVRLERPDALLTLVQLGELLS